MITPISSIKKKNRNLTPRLPLGYIVSYLKYSLRNHRYSDMAHSKGQSFRSFSYEEELQRAKGLKEDLDKLMDDSERGANATLSVDLETQTISGPDGGSLSFEIDPFKKECLLEGLDDVGLTMKKEEKIVGFEDEKNASMPWLHGLQHA